MLTLIAYAFMLMEPIGFIIPQPQLAVGFPVLAHGRSAYAPRLLTGLISAVVVFFLFNYGLDLQLSLPAGILRYRRS